MTQSGFCAFPAAGSHAYCREVGLRCTCPCHTDLTATAALEAELDAVAAGYLAESDIVPAGESGEGQGT